MDRHAVEYYTPYSEKNPNGHFHRVIPLQDEPVLEWKEASELAPCLPRGWYELSRLDKKDRIDFIRDFWSLKLPYHPKIDLFLTNFFSSVDDIGIVLIQKKYEDPFQSQLVYSLSGNNGFFHGNPPINKEERSFLEKDFSQMTLPPDYLAFLEIHNGFAKLMDTGICSSNVMKENYTQFQDLMMGIDELKTTDGTQVNPSSLIPFYQSFDLPFFQCFWKDWYPDQEMGNVYYSGLTHTISICKEGSEGCETMAFETFIDWLMFYLEKIE